MSTGYRQLGPQLDFSHLTEQEVYDQVYGRPFENEDLGVALGHYGLDCFFFEPEQFRNIHGICQRFGGVEMDGVLVGETTDEKFKFALVVWCNTGYEPTVDYVHERDIA